MTTAQPIPAPPAWPQSPAGSRRVSDLLHELGDIPAERVRLIPSPGTATEADLLAVNNAADRTALVELVDGTLVEKAMGFDEDRLAFLIGHFLLSFVLPRKLGIVAGSQGMLRMHGGNVRMPDVSFIAWSSIAGRLPTGPVKQIPPDLAVEVLSEPDTRPEMDRKRAEYFASGGKLVWEFEPGPRTVAVYHEPTRPAALLTAADTLNGGAVLPGFSLPLADLFALLDERPNT